VGGHPEGVEGRAGALGGRRLSLAVSARRRREAGFSLLEALLAATVLATGVLVTTQGFSLGARAAALGRQYTQAALLAQSELTELMLEQNLATVEPEGEFADAPLPGARWSFTLEDTGTPGLGRLTVTVAWGGVGTGGVGERQLSLSALRPDFTVLTQTAGGSTTPASAGSTASGGGGP
jgi:hypothetical protein